MSDVVVTTRAGRVRGSVDADGIATFRGIPYAAAPTGPLRFAGPAPVPAWRGVRDATRPGATPLRAVPNARGVIPEHTVAGDEVLNLSVFSAAGQGDDGDPRPVLVWIHGGAYHEGSAGDPRYDMTAFAALGVVGVAINYRVGFDGYGFVPDAVQNRGVRDWVAALEWVRDNIDRFGGDPGRVTIAGQSSGASAVLRLLTLAHTRGLFHAAIAQSPAELDISRDAARSITGALAAHLGVAPTLAGLSDLPVGVIQSAQYRSWDAAPAPSAGGWVRAAGIGTTLRYMPVIDDDLVAGPMLDESRRGLGHDVPLLIGAVVHEMDTPAPFVDECESLGALAILTEAWGEEGAREYLSLLPETIPAREAVGQFVSDRIFRRTVPRFARSRTPGTTWVYEFAVPDETGRVSHSSEIPHLFGVAAGSAVGARMRADWVTFARTGDPGWAAAGHRGAGRRYGVDDVDQPLFERESALFLDD